MRRTCKLLSLVGIFLLVAACGQDGSDSAAPAASAFSQADSLALKPADTELAQIYERSCRSCHTIAATGSPLTGDKAAWAPRMEKGMNTLIDNVINGFGGMPPLGLCMDCSADQFEALIDFMATPPGDTP